MPETRQDRLAAELLRRYEIAQRQSHGAKPLSKAAQVEVAEVNAALIAALAKLGRMADVRTIDAKFVKSGVKIVLVKPSAKK